MCPAGETVTLVSLLSTVVPTKKRRFVHSVIEKKQQQLNKFFFGPVKVRTKTDSRVVSQKTLLN